MGQTSCCFNKFILFLLAKAGTLIMAMDPDVIDLNDSRPFYESKWIGVHKKYPKKAPQYIEDAKTTRFYESHLWDLFLYAAADADFAGPAVTLRCPDIL